VAVPISRAQSAPPQFVYYAQTGFPAIFGFQLNPATGVLTPILNSPFNERSSPSVMAVNPAGTFLFVANGAGNNNVSVFAINQTTGTLTELLNSPFATGLGMNPTVMTTDQSGKYLYVGNQTGTVAPSFGIIDSYAINQTTGELTPTPASTPPSPGNFGIPYPSGVYVHPNGRWIYFQGGFGGGQLNNTIQGFEISPTGDINAFTTFNGLSSSRALTGDPAGQHLINQYGDTCQYLQVLSISAVDGSLTPGTTWSSIDSALDLCFGAPGVTFDSTGNFLFMAFGSFFFTNGTLVVDQVPPGPQQSFTLGVSLGDPIGPYLLTLSAHVFAINPTTGVLTDVPGSPFNNAGGNMIALTGYPTLNRAPGAQYSPGNLTFTNTTPGVPSAPQMIELVNTGTATLNISGISIVGTNHSDFMQTNTCSTTLIAGANCVFTVIYTPSTTAAESASIQVMDSATGSPHLASLTGVGVVQTPPMPSANPTSLTFPQTNVGSTSSLNYTISNAGTETLTISGFAIQGANPLDFKQMNSCGGSVGGLASCPVTVVFQPQAAGLRTATATVSFGANGSASVMVSGDGSIAPPPFTVMPTGPTSVTVPPNQPATFGASFTPIPTFSGTANLTCTVLPALGPICNVSPAMVQVVASNNPLTTPVKVMVNTSSVNPAVANRQGAGFSVATSASGTAAFMRAAIGWPLGFCSLALLFLFAITSRSIATATPRRLQFSSVALALAIAALCVVASCGGGSSSISHPPPQNFKIMLTATAGANTQTINFNLTVQ
jgi:hypothetical protein